MSCDDGLFEGNAVVEADGDELGPSLGETDGVADGFEDGDALGWVVG